MTTTTTTAPVATVTLNKEAADTMHAALLSGVRDFLKARRDLVKAVKAAQKSDLYKVRGFASWADYAAATVTEALPKTASKDEREWVAVLLVHCGVSTRAAAAAADLSQPTVSRRASGAKGAEVAAEVAEVTGDEKDAAPATVTTSKSGKTQTRTATRGKGKPAADKAAAPKEQPKRTAHAVATEAVAAISGVWHNLTLEQRSEIAEMILDLPAVAE
jgi:transposase